MSIFKDASEVRAFISWCREQKIQGVEIGDIKVAFSPLAFVDPQSPSREHEAEKPPKVDPSTGYTEDELYR